MKGKRIGLSLALLAAALPAQAMYGFEAPDTYFHDWDATWAGQQILIEDANEDGLDDVLLTTIASPDPFSRQASLLVLLQDSSTHRLAAPKQYPVTPLEWNTGNVSSIARGDVNGDGVDDIIVGHTDGVTVLDQAHAYAITSVIEDRENFSYLYPKIARVGDFDGDGNLDIAALTVIFDAVSRLKIYRGDGAGHFDGGTELALPATCCFRGLQVQDINADAKPDIVLSVEPTNPPYDGQFGLWAYYNSGDAFGNAPKFLAQGGGSGFAVGDIDGDGTPDLATGYYDPHPSGPSLPVMRVYLHGKLGTPYRQFRQWSSNSGGADVISDLDGDGTQDLLYRDGGYTEPPESGLGGCLETYVPSGGKYAYRYPLACYGGLSMGRVATGDINGDGLMDIVYGDNKGGVGWALGTLSPDIKNLVVGEGFAPGAVAFNAQNASTTASIAEPTVEVVLSASHGVINMTSWPEECSRPNPKKNRIVCQYDNLGAGQSATGVVHYSVVQSAPYMQMTATTRATTSTVETIPSDNTTTKAIWIRQL